MSIIRVALDLPLHRQFDYLATEAGPDDVGRRVNVPFGRSDKVGLITAVGVVSEFSAEQLRPAGLIHRDLPPLPADWFRLVQFCAEYYQAALGEALLAALPRGLRRPTPPARRPGRKLRRQQAALPPPLLTADQQQAVERITGAAPGFQAWLLHGITGSGKTEVYLRLIAAALARGQQVLLLVPEINLTPQLELRVAQRFPEVAQVSLHSELTEAARVRGWEAAFSGQARLVLGTRLAVFTPMPDLGLILIDEEHDASYKQQDGIRYSARDLAVFRARDRDIPVVLGSATPSLESWANLQQGRYQHLSLAARAVSGARLPRIERIDLRHEPAKDGLSAPLLAAIAETLARGEQSLIFLNRRGYAPVLACTACGWAGRCQRCTANLVLHLADRRLRCHHCGAEAHIPRQCPTCGNQDIHPFGRGTQRLEESLAAHFPQARLLRADRDVARSRRQWEALAAQIHAGEADVLVGTQMLAKGHDFPRLTLVGVVGADAALQAGDWRAPERLFAQLMQVAGRAGRAEWPGRVLIQTQYPEHPLYAALAANDYPGFAASQLAERRSAGFPPYTFQALLRVDAPQMAAALALLEAARQWPGQVDFPEVMIYDPVPLRLARRANLDRAQLLVECASRQRLQAFLPVWRAAIAALPDARRLAWHLEVDPLEV